jgi:pimeloyl-ACP methyl ester carboxylesterase
MTTGARRPQAGAVASRTVQASGLEFGLLEAGSGPLALCLHGFPDTAYTWRYLLPDLAAAGFHAVAPFMRGYAPTQVPADGRYGLSALAGDALALHEALGGDEHAVLIGHDWGAEAAYEAAATAPGRWRRLVTLAVPPAALDPVLFTDYEQLRRFFYIFLFRDTPGLAEQIVAADGMRFLERLWQDWSPGYDATDSLAHVADSLRDTASLSAAIGYYRAAQTAELPADTGAGPGAAPTMAAAATAAMQPPDRPAGPPTLYLHGSADGCIAVDLVQGAQRHLSAGSKLTVIPDAGHFLQVERPAEVNRHILDWLGS